MFSRLSVILLSGFARLIPGTFRGYVQGTYCFESYTSPVYKASAMTLATLFSLKNNELLENGVATHFQATALFSMRAVSLASSQICCSVDAHAWCKRAHRNAM